MGLTSMPSSAGQRWWVPIVVVSGFVVCLTAPIHPALAEDPPPPNQTNGPANPATLPAGATDAAIEAARVQTFLDSRYKASDVTHSFRTQLGDTIDCIDFFAQPGVRSLAASGTPIQKLPPSVARPPGTDPLFDGKPDQNGNLRQCPEGTVPQVRSPLSKSKTPAVSTRTCPVSRSFRLASLRAPFLRGRNNRCWGRRLSRACRDLPTRIPSAQAAIIRQASQRWRFSPEHTK